MCNKSHPKYFLYNTKNWNINQIVLHSFTRKDWIEELTNIDSITYLLIKEEVEELFYNTGNYLNYLDFDSVYKLAVEVTKAQVEKSIKKNKKCFFQIQNNDNLLIYKKIKERLVNNIKNLFDSKRKTNVLNFEILIIDKIYENHEIDFTIRDLQKLAKNEPKLIIEHIKTLANNFELTIIEIEDISEKLDLNLSHIIDSCLLSPFINLKKAINNNQLYLDFNEELMVS